MPANACLMVSEEAKAMSSAGKKLIASASHRNVERQHARRLRRTTDEREDLRYVTYWYVLYGQHVTPCLLRLPVTVTLDADALMPRHFHWPKLPLRFPIAQNDRPPSRYHRHRRVCFLCVRFCPRTASLFLQKCLHRAQHIWWSQGCLLKRRLPRQSAERWSYRWAQDQRECVDQWKARKCRRWSEGQPSSSKLYVSISCMCTIPCCFVHRFVQEFSHSFVSTRPRDTNMIWLVSSSSLLGIRPSQDSLFMQKWRLWDVHGKNKWAQPEGLPGYYSQWKMRHYCELGV